MLLFLSIISVYDLYNLYIENRKLNFCKMFYRQTGNTAILLGVAMRRRRTAKPFSCIT